MAESTERAPAVRVAVIGAGFAASSHLDALARLGGVEVAGIVASTPERGREAAERFGLARSYDRAEDALQDGTVDAVHVCVPNVHHAGLVAAALEAGKHVLCEKPLAMSSPETGELTRLAARSDRVTGVCFNYRHFPLVQELRVRLAGTGAGAAHLVRGSYLQDWLLFPDDWNWRLESGKAGSTRAVGDIGSHWIDLAQHVTGDRVVAVMADLGRLHGERVRPGEVETFARASGTSSASGETGGGERVAVDTEDHASVLLRFASGAHGALTVSQVTPGRKNRLLLEVDTERASFSWDQEDPNRLWVGRRDRPNEEVVRDPGLLSPAAAPLARFPGGHQEGWPDALRNLFEDFYGAVRDGAEGGPRTFASFAEADRVTRIVEAIADSDRRQAWVQVEGEVS